MFTGESPFSHSALDIKTYAMTLMNKEYRDSTKRNMPRAWFDALPHTPRAGRRHRAGRALLQYAGGKCARKETVMGAFYKVIQRRLPCADGSR
jgi:hypothetical protein